MVHHLRTTSQYKGNKSVLYSSKHVKYWTDNTGCGGFVGGCDCFVWYFRSSGGAPHTSTSPGTTSVSHVPTTLPVSASLPSATTSAEPEGVPLVGGSAAGSSTSAMPLNWLVFVYKLRLCNAGLCM